MKALSIMQPWAYLICIGVKPIENRTWWTAFRGPVLIHAGKKFDRGFDWEWAIARGAPDLRYGYFDMGGIVGIANLTDCVPQSSSPWFVGPYGFVMENAQQLPFLPYRGALGFFEVEVPA